MTQAVTTPAKSLGEKLFEAFGNDGWEIRVALRGPHAALKTEGA